MSKYIRLFKKFSMVITLIIAILLGSISANAAIYQKIVDNDTIDPTCLNTRNGFGTYLTTGYNGDSRFQASSSSSLYYTWSFPGITTTNSVKWTLNVYLDNYSFTDPSAYYKIERGENTYIYFAENLTINQNTAPSGWSTVQTGTRTIIVTGANLSPYRVTVSPSGLGSSYGTGADAMNVYFTY